MPPSNPEKKVLCFNSIEELNKYTEPKKLVINNALQCKQHCKSANDVYKKADALYNSLDEENAYILFMRYFEIVQGIKKTYEFQKSKVHYISILNQSDAGAAITKAEKLQESLTARYKKHQIDLLEKQEKQLLLEKQNKKRKQTTQPNESDASLDDLILPDVPSENSLTKTLTNDKAPAPRNNEVSNIPLPTSNHARKKATAGYISVMDLYTLLKENKENTKSILVIDIRTAEEYKAARIIHDCMLHVPESLLKVGANINSIERKLNKETWMLWKERFEKCFLIIIDYNFDESVDSKTCPAYLLQDVLCNTDSSYQVLIVTGGFKQWHLHFPSMTTNPSYSKMPKFPVIIDPSSLLKFLTYPELPTSLLNNKKQDTLSDTKDTLSDTKDTLQHPELYPELSKTKLYPDVPNRASIEPDSAPKAPLVDKLAAMRRMLSESNDDISDDIIVPSKAIKTDKETDVQQIEATKKHVSAIANGHQFPKPALNDGQNKQTNKMNDTKALQQVKAVNSVANKPQVVQRENNSNISPSNMSTLDVASLIKPDNQQSGGVYKPSTQKQQSEGVVPKPVLRNVPSSDKTLSNVAQPLIPSNLTQPSIPSNLTQPPSSNVSLPSDRLTSNMSSHVRLGPTLLSHVSQPNMVNQTPNTVNQTPNKVNQTSNMGNQFPNSVTQTSKMVNQTSNMVNQTAPNMAIQTPSKVNQTPNRINQTSQQNNLSNVLQSKVSQQGNHVSLTSMSTAPDVHSGVQTVTDVPKPRMQPSTSHAAANKNSISNTQNEIVKQKVPAQKFTTTFGLPYGWEKAINHENGRIYYKDHNTRQTHWVLPPEIQAKMLQSDASDKNVESKEKPQQHDKEVEARSTLKRSLSSPNLAKDIIGENKAASSRPVIDRSAKPKDKPVVVDRSTKPISASRLQKLSPVYGSKGRSLTGLKNLGNTCYMNSVIQCLVNTSPLTSYFVNGIYEQHLNSRNMNAHPGELARDLAFVIVVLSSGQYRSVSPVDFKRALGRFSSQFSGYQQQDSHELLMFLLDGLHEDVNKVKVRQAIKERDNDKLQDVIAADLAWKDYSLNNNSVIVDLFQGQFRSTVVCLSCGKQSKTFDAFNCLQLELPPNHSATLESCIKSFTKPEKIGGNDSWKCSNCKCYREAAKTIEIWKLPPVLIVQLKRFRFDGRWHNKIQTAVNFPIQNLNMSTHIVAPSMKFSSYHLYGVINHYGSFESGHYTAYCENVYNNKWYSYDDNYVKEIDTNSVKTSAAYLLFYTAVNFKDYVKGR